MKLAVLLAVLAGVCWGVGEVCARAVLSGGKVGPITAITVRTAVQLPVLLALWYIARGSWSAETNTAPFSQLGVKTWILLIVGAGLIAGAGGMACFYSALAFGEVSVVKPIAFSIAPAIGVTLGWLALGEAMTVRKALALALIIGGVVLLTWNAGHHPKPARAAAKG